MTMKTKIVICLGALLAVAATNVLIKQVMSPRAKLTIKVLDEAGHPFPNATVQLNFRDAITREGKVVEGKTDADGLFSGEGGSDGQIGGSVRLDGYYMSGFPFKPFTAVENGRWQPWNVTYTTTLRPIGKPIALFARKVQTHVPVLDQPCGYDLKVGDWVSPYGNGNTADFIFTISRELRSALDFDARADLTFTNPQDGLQQASVPAVGSHSALKWERFAPDEGFEPRLQIRNAWFPPESGRQPIRSFKGQDEWQGYFFRVRSLKQGDKIISAHYGKIRGDIAIDPRDSKTCALLFTYYFNPTPLDRNLEWNTKSNLFSGLSWQETPRDP